MPYPDELIQFAVGRNNTITINTHTNTITFSHKDNNMNFENIIHIRYVLHLKAL